MIYAYLIRIQATLHLGRRRDDCEMGARDDFEMDAAAQLSSALEMVEELSPGKKRTTFELVGAFI